MTREEAIRIIKIVLVVAEDFEITVQGEEFTEEKCKEAVDMAIKALEQEPCEELDFVQPHKKVSVNLETSEWTPVSERFPEENGRYFVTVKLGYVTTAIWAGIAEDWDKVIAWMPFFPKPYKASPTGAESEE